MAISQTKAILRLFNNVCEKGIIVQENESIDTIIKLCEKKGQFIFYGDSYWSFVKTKLNNKNCVRMIFALKDNCNGKVHNIDRIIGLIKSVELILIFIDEINISTKKDFIYLDIIKNI